MRTPAWCRRNAAGTGPACEQLIGELLADNALYRLRAAQGVIGLAARRGSHRGTGGIDQEAVRSEQVNDAVNKILDALRSNGYEPALRIEDVEVHGTE